MFQDDEKFCANPRCVLHVSANDPHVEGRGEWATLPNGCTFARVLVAEQYFCHACADDPANPLLRDLFGTPDT